MSIKTNTTVKKLVRKGKKTGIVDAEDILENIEVLKQDGINTQDMISHLSGIGISVKIQNATGKEASGVVDFAECRICCIIAPGSGEIVGFVMARRDVPLCVLQKKKMLP